MDNVRQRLEALFEAALELPAAARTAMLERECANDPGLRAKVERLLSAHAASAAFFADCGPALVPSAPAAAGPPTPPVDKEVGQHIGPYKILQVIGEGGCGVVFMAEQETPVRRRVALKIIKLGMDTKSVIARFEAERQALAMMDHPNIARVLDAGATATGRPYFVMELVHGIRITEYCDTRQLDTRARLDLFIQVCHAIQHAHQKGIVHRDIKPSNILVTHLDGEATPKVIDFGIAKAIEGKLTEKTLFTIYGHFIGTPAYMSPEQADYSGLDVDTRSDIYSLGVLLYELLTGRPPFEQDELMAAGIDEMRRMLREREPHRPSTRLDTFPADELTATAMRRHVEPPKLQLLLKGDLDWIVMKALEKDRRRRYETANGLAMDVRRFLDHEPVLARSPSRWYRFQKLVRRNRGVFAGAGAVALALIIGLGAATWMFIQERQMRQRAVAAEQVAETARANEAELRRLAETREKITQAAFLISQGKLNEAEQAVAAMVIQQPTLEGAAVLRTLGEWQALNRRWPTAARSWLQVLKADPLDNTETVALDHFQASVVLATVGDTARFALFQQQLAQRFAREQNAVTAATVLAAGMLQAPPRSEIWAHLQAVIAPPPLTSIGGTRRSEGVFSASAPGWFQKFKLENVGTSQPADLRQEDDTITLVSGGSDIWETRDEFAYACARMTGDFDFCMQVQSVAPMLNKFTRVGLMAREAADSPGSRHVMVAMNAADTFQVVMRAEENAVATSVPQNPLPAAYGSNSWLRLQRVGAIFHAYTSSNGVDWLQLYQTTGGDKPFSDPIYFGLAASSHATNAISTNVVCHFAPTLTMPPKVGIALALADYRTGQFEATATWCRRLDAYPECNAAEFATAEVLAALADRASDRPVDSRRQIDLAREAINQKLAGEIGPGSKTEGYWYEWLFARTLLTEADLRNR